MKHSSTITLEVSLCLGPTSTSVVNLIGLLEDTKILQMHTAKTNL
jgi:hypothetical protein